MKPTTPLAIIAFIVISCNNNNDNQNAISVTNDSILAVSQKIQNTVDSVKAPLLTLQTRIQGQLDSFNKALSNTQAMSPADFKNLEKQIGVKLSQLEKISKVQPLEEEFNKTYMEARNSSKGNEIRIEKLQKLESLSNTLKDSIAATISRITNQ